MGKTSWTAGLGLSIVAGCAGAPPPSSPSTSPEPTLLSEPTTVAAGGSKDTVPGPLFEVAGSCRRAHPGAGARRFGPVRTSSSVALAASGEAAQLRVLAYVADGDEPTLHTIDVTQGRQIALTALRGVPEQVLVLADGRVAVTLRQSSEVQILEPGAQAEAPLEARCAFQVPTEPVSLAESPDGGTLALTSAWARALTVLDATTLAARSQVQLPREPRSVVISDDGRRAFVAHVVNATLSVVDLHEPDATPRAIDLKMKPMVPGTRQQPRSGCQGFALVSSVEMPSEPSQVGPAPQAERPPVAVKPPPPAPAKPPPGPAPRTRPAGRLFAPFVTVDPGEATRQSSGYGDLNAPIPTEFSSISVLDAAAERLFTRTLAGVVPGGQPGSPGDAPASDCLLPRAAAYADGSLYVTCQGNNVLIEYDARTLDPARAESRRWKAPTGASGVAIDTVHKLAVVHGQFEHKLRIVNLQGGNGQEVPLKRLGKGGLSPEQERGRVLFHTTHDPRISSDGRACASCHPDGREDALTWSTPEGPRQTVMLQGRLQDSGPFGWNGSSATEADHLRHTFQRLGGTGLLDSEVKDLVAYLHGTRAPSPGRPTRWEQQRQARVARGREVFNSAETACASCHPGGATDGQTHQVMPVQGKNRLAAATLDTPSLRFIGASAPYFHDGRYTTLEAMLEASDHAMGYSLHLDREQRQALLAYLESL
ncbi:MAG: c-type cytochrome [Polyangiaceae bacterium]|nr:c-type cytochrome [Polyangiaceae bacterium]